MTLDEAFFDEMATFTHAAMSGEPMVASSSVMHEEKPVEEPETEPAINIEAAEIKFPYKETDDVEITAQLAIDYYSALHLAGNKLQLEWNGGGDSGSVWLNLNGKQIEDYWDSSKSLNLYDKIHAWVIDKMYDVLDYGSWAGEFSASGTADFQIHNGFIGFQGTDFYSEEDYHTTSLNPSLKVFMPIEYIPEHVNEILVNATDGYDGSEPNISILFRTRGDWKHKNDELSEEAQKYVSVLEDKLSKEFGEIMNKVGASNTYFDKGFEVIDRTAALEMEFDEFDYYTSMENPKEVSVNLLDWIE